MSKRRQNVALVEFLLKTYSRMPKDLVTHLLISVGFLTNVRCGTNVSFTKDVLTFSYIYFQLADIKYRDTRLETNTTGYKEWTIVYGDM